MLKNYLKVALRSLKNNKFFSTINIGGLSTGLAVAIMLLLWVQDELSFDGFHKNARNIYHAGTAFRQEDGKENFWSNTPAPLAFRGKKEIPDVEDACRVTTNWDLSFFVYRNKKFFDIKSGLADPSFFTLFSFPLIKGDPQKPFTDDHSVVLSLSTAKKIFGDEDPMGKVIEGDDKKPYRVSGIMKDIPPNSSIRYDLIFSFDFLNQRYNSTSYWKSLNEDWGNFNYDTYFLLRPASNAGAVGQKLTQFHREAQADQAFVKNLNYQMQPLNRMHLYSPDGKEAGITIVRIFFIVAVIILLIACINYTNLVTARATKRAKEISMRKIIGAGKMNLFWQFLSESAVILLLSLLAATGLIYLALPLYNDIAGKEIAFSPFSKDVLLVYAVTALLTLAMAGIYPAITLSSFRPLEAMKGRLSGLGKNIAFRKILVVIQFTFSILLIVSTIVIGKQLKYIREKNLGYDKENILSFNMGEINKHLDVAKAELNSQPGILGVTATGQDILNIGSSTVDADWDGKTPQQQSFIINQIPVDKDFIKTMGLQLAQGNDFTGTEADSIHYILNETAIKEMGLKAPVVGKRFTFHGRKGFIADIVKDFHFQDLHTRIAPIILFYNPDWRWKMYVKTTAKDASKAIAAVAKLWKRYNPEYPLNYTFLDDSFNELYKSDLRVGKLFNGFALIAILISCLGLFGLVTYTAESRVKEIGVRKVLGASVLNIVSMLSKEFLLLIFIATLIAFPVAWWALYKMLQQYAYRTEISGWVFVLSGSIILVIALMTVSLQAVKAALANPVKSLKTE
jgi:putative ABC transport system permease protein